MESNRTSVFMENPPLIHLGSGIDYRRSIS